MCYYTYTVFGRNERNIMRDSGRKKWIKHIVSAIVGCLIGLAIVFVYQNLHEELALKRKNLELESKITDQVRLAILLSCLGILMILQ